MRRKIKLFGVQLVNILVTWRELALSPEGAGKPRTDAATTTTPVQYLGGIEMQPSSRTLRPLSSHLASVVLVSLSCLIINSHAET
ncbi:MAG TPA: hypothetical protein VFH91_06945, partial [Pyrinomonadaceae bacterium]|nr:hypothetical protein [Pyrinomonadaceae bacterium]